MFKLFKWNKCFENLFKYVYIKNVYNIYKIYIKNRKVKNNCYLGYYVSSSAKVAILIHILPHFLRFYIYIYINFFTGYLCELGDVQANGCCNRKSNSTEQYSCLSCQVNRCCKIYEHCISCCLQPQKVITIYCWEV